MVQSRKAVIQTPKRQCQIQFGRDILISHDEGHNSDSVPPNPPPPFNFSYGIALTSFTIKNVVALLWPTISVWFVCTLILAIYSMYEYK
jgi:hypothetical protein